MVSASWYGEMAIFSSGMDLLLSFFSVVLPHPEASSAPASSNPVIFFHNFILLPPHHKQKWAAKGSP